MEFTFQGWTGGKLNFFDLPNKYLGTSLKIFEQIEKVEATTITENIRTTEEKMSNQ